MESAPGKLWDRPSFPRTGRAKEVGESTKTEASCPVLRGAAAEMSCLAADRTGTWEAPCPTPASQRTSELSSWVLVQSIPTQGAPASGLH